MTWPARSGLVVTGILLLCGCHRIYMGYYAVPPETAAGVPTHSVLTAEVEKVVIPIGFNRLPDQGGGAASYVNSRPITTEGGDRYGQARIAVSVDPWGGIVMIQDQDHDYETEFVRVLKTSLAQRLEAQYPSATIVFVRRLDLFQ